MTPKYKCPICGAETSNLRSHVYKKHNMKASEFKEKYGDWANHISAEMTVPEDINKIYTTISDLTKVIQDISMELGRLREKISMLEEKINSSTNTATSPAPAQEIVMPKIDESAAEALKAQLSTAEQQCRNMAKFIYDSLQYLKSVGAKLEYKSLPNENGELIVFDIRVAARGLDRTVNKWKIFSFDQETNIYVSEFDAEWAKTFEDVKEQIITNMRQTNWRPEHLRGLKRLVRKIQKAAKEIGLNLVFE